MGTIHSARSLPSPPSPQRRTCHPFRLGDQAQLETLPLTDLLSQTGQTIIPMMRTQRKIRIPTTLTAPYGTSTAVFEWRLMTSLDGPEKVSNAGSFLWTRRFAIKDTGEISSGLKYENHWSLSLLRNQRFLPKLEISKLLWIMHGNQRFNLITSF